MPANKGFFLRLQLPNHSNSRPLTAINGYLSLFPNRAQSLALHSSSQQRGRGLRSYEPTDPSHTMLVGYGRASSTRLNGVSVARRKWLYPASDMTWPRRASPAWAPSPSPTSCASELGVHRKVEPA